jgi:hypothetical protein
MCAQIREQMMMSEKTKDEVLRERDARTNAMMSRLRDLASRFLDDVTALREEYLAEATGAVAKLMEAVAADIDRAEQHALLVDAIRVFVDARVCEGAAQLITESIESAGNNLAEALFPVYVEACSGFGQQVTAEALETLGGSDAPFAAWTQRGGEA